MSRSLAVGFAGAAALMSGHAAAAPGDLFVAEYNNGSVLEFSAGGDLSAAQRFATGLTNPTGICVGPGGDIYVAESGSGQITIITDGGDFSSAAPFAEITAAVFVPTGLFCTDDTIYATHPLAPAPLIMDASSGGDIGQAPFVFATGLPGPGDFLAMDDGSLYVTNIVGVGAIFDVAAGGDFAAEIPWASGRILMALEAFDGMILGAAFGAPEVVDITAGGDTSDPGNAPVFATLPGAGTATVEGLLNAEGIGLLAMIGDSIYDVSAGGDLTGAPAFASGLQNVGIGYAGMAHHVCGDDDDCDDGDPCTGVDVCTDNSCAVPDGPPDCNDSSLCTTDTCDAAIGDPSTGCVNIPVEGCCESDSDCAADEVCDLDNNTCVDAGVGEDSADGGNDSAGGSTGGAGTGPGADDGASGLGSGESGDDSAGADGGDDASGCACHTSAPGAGGLGLLALVPLVLGRRRRWPGSRRRALA